MAVGLVVAFAFAVLSLKERQLHCLGWHLNLFVGHAHHLIPHLMRYEAIVGSTFEA